MLQVPAMGQALFTGVERFRILEASWDGEWGGWKPKPLLILGIFRFICSGYSLTRPHASPVAKILNSAAKPFPALWALTKCSLSAYLLVTSVSCLKTFEYVDKKLGRNFDSGKQFCAFKFHSKCILSASGHFSFLLKISKI